MATLIWHSQLPAFMHHMQSADSVRRFFENQITAVGGCYGAIALIKKLQAAGVRIDIERSRGTGKQGMFV